MVSQAVMLSCFIWLISGFVPLKKGNSPVKDTTTITTRFTDIKEEDSSEIYEADSQVSLPAEDTFENDVSYHVFLYRIKLSPKDPTLANVAKRQYRRKADDNKEPVTSSHKSTTNSKTSDQYDPLMKILFEQKFKLKTNTSTSRRRKPPRRHRGSSRDGIGPGHDDRMDRILSILAIFGEHFQTDHTVANTAVDIPSETITITTQSPGVRPRDMSCIHVEGYNQYRWIHIVNFCARDWNNETVRYMCKDALVTDYIMTDTPVQDSEGTVYANRYCAFCNHIHVSKIRKWQVAWTCERNNNPAASLMHTDIFGDLMHIVTSLRLGNTCKMIRAPAIPQAISECSAPVIRNSQSMPLMNAEKHVPPGSGYPVSLNILMNFDFSGKTHIMFEDLYAEESIETKLCPQGNYVWDGEMGRCREVVCAKGYHFDESYTTCLKDEGAVTNNEEEVITDLSQLAQSNDIERVTLEVEVPSGFAALVTITKNEFWKEQIAKQLNISINRIQEFNITVENATGQASTLLIQKLSNGGGIPGVLDDFDYSEENVYQGTTISKGLAEGASTGKSSGYREGSSSSLGTSEPLPSQSSAPTLTAGDIGLRKNYAEDISQFQDNLETTVTADDDGSENSQADVTATLNLAVQDYETTTSETEVSSGINPPASASSEEEKEEGEEPYNFKIIMSFILLPPETFRSGEQRSGNVVKALSSLVSSREFKFIINGTSLKVQNITQEDKVGVFSPPCPHGVLLVLDEDQIELITDGDSPLGSNFTALKDLRTGKYYLQGMFDVSFIFTQPIGNTTEKPQSFVYNALACEMPRITDSHCSRIFITAEEYTIRPITKTLTFQNSTFNISSYEFLNDNYDQVEICVPESYKEAMAMHPSRMHYYYYTKNCATDYQNWLKAEGYLTTILGRISIAALFIVLLTYFLFPKLRNLPGVNTMNLTFALFLAEAIFDAGEEVQIPWLCTAVAATLHYCFLSSHCWMNVMSYDVYRTFAASTCILTRVRDKRKMFPRYALYAWGMPLVVLGACLVIDLGQVFPGISIGYGGTWSRGVNESGVGNWSSEETFPDMVTTTMKNNLSQGDGSGTVQEEVRMLNSSEDVGSVAVGTDRSFSCWIQEPLAALFVFGAPILLIFLMNCVFFVRTIASIRKTNRLARHSGAGRTNSSNSARRISGHNDVILYVKMSSVMGFTWVFGLASSIISSLTQEPSDVICYTLHVLGVLFPILNSSQGLFILFAFVFNRRVLGLYRDLGRKIKTFVVEQTKGLEASA